METKTRPAKNHSPVLTVTQLNQQVQQLLTQDIGSIWLSGEISNCSQPASGHCYFTLKDAQAQVRCALFYQRRGQVELQPSNGLQVLVAAQVTLYSPRGDYQLIIESLQALGTGLLQQRFEQLKQQLAAEGLFATHHKQPLPRYPQRLGIITSSSSAALQDILQILKRRDPTLPVVIYPSAVQGSSAPEQLVQVLQRVSSRQECDVLILARGGGTLEDLWSFNEATVARAIFDCPIPIVSAVGHETDVTIADLVADLRAPTPSAAAELVSRDQQTLRQQLITLLQYLTLAADHALAGQKSVLQTLQQRLYQQHPQRQLARQQTSLLLLLQRLRTAGYRRLQRLQTLQEHSRHNLRQQSPLRRLYQHQKQLQQHHSQLQQIVLKHYQATQQRLTTLCTRLHSASPLATLGRGFSLTLDLQGQPIRSLHQVTVGQIVQTRLQAGCFDSVITRLTTLS
jgi:exodeoxyribonuclease VII large subunit